MEEKKSFDPNIRKMQYGKNNGHVETQIQITDSRQMINQKIDSLIRKIDLVLNA